MAVLIAMERDMHGNMVFAHAVSQMLAYLLVQAEQVIQEDNMLEALGIIELYCKCLVEKAAQLDKPQYLIPALISGSSFLVSDTTAYANLCLLCRECSEEIKEATAGIIFAAKWCNDLPELQFARKILTDKFGDDFAAEAREGTAFVDPMVKVLIFIFWTPVDLELQRRKATVALHARFVLPSQLVWKLSGDTTNMELKKKVTKQIAAENDMSVDFSHPI